MAPSLERVNHKDAAVIPGKLPCEKHFLIGASSFINSYCLQFMEYAKMRMRKWSNSEDTTQDFLCYVIRKIYQRGEIRLSAKYPVPVQVKMIMHSYFIDWYRHYRLDKRRNEDAKNAYYKEQYETYSKLSDGGKNFLNDHDHVYLDFNIIKKMFGRLNLNESIILKLLAGEISDLSVAELRHLRRKHKAGAKRLNKELQDYYKLRRKCISTSKYYLLISGMMKMSPNAVRCSIGRIKRKMAESITELVL